MSRHKFSIFLLLLISFILAYHLTALDKYLYWRYWWFDVPPHFLGGLWIALFAIWLVFYSGYIKPVGRGRLNLFLITFIPALVIGIIWEVYEYIIIGVIPIQEGYSLDTILDVFTDMAGALTGYLMSIHFIKKSPLLSKVLNGQ